MAITAMDKIRIKSLIDGMLAASSKPTQQQAYAEISDALAHLATNDLNAYLASIKFWHMGWT
jgi:hypothetical protein